jgi:hypothetical protein
MKTILIADDLDINFLLLQTYLKSDFAILRAHDGSRSSRRIQST